MRIIVFGATGGSGRATVQELLAGGHEVTAFSRHAGEIGIPHERLRTVTGDVLNGADVERALEGQEAVVVTLGVNDNPLKMRLLKQGRTPINVCSAGTRNIIDAMKRANVPKLIIESAYGIGETASKLPLPFRLAYRLLIKDQMADKEVQERLVRDSGLDWVIVQPVALTNGEPKGEVFASPNGEARHNSVSRRDVGRFLAELTASQRFARQSVAVSAA